MNTTRRTFLKSGLITSTIGLNLNAKSKPSINDPKCGLTTGGKVFKFKNESQRIRKSFYDLSDEELRNLCKAIGYMRNDIPTDSPLHWENYGRQHAHHCTEASEGNPQVHWSWYFLPWHRGYIYFLERILANILTTQFNIDGSKFAYPYWDWMVHKEIPNTRLREQAGLASPLFGYDLTQENMVNADNLGFDNTALYDGNRGPTILKSKMDPNNELTVDSQNHVKDTIYYTSPEYIYKILNAPWDQFGGKSTIDRNTGQGLLEQNPHNDGHDWVGTRIGKNRTMGTLRYAALDPIFYMHHGNIDRIFSMYKQPMPDLDGPWGQQMYQYTDIDGSWVTVSVKDIMTTITNNVSYDKLLTATKPSKVNRKISSNIGLKVEKEPVSISLKGSTYKEIFNSSIALIDVITGPITFTGKYQIDIYLTDGVGVKTNIGRIRMLDGDHRKHNKNQTLKHTFSILSKPVKVSSNGDLTLTFVPPNNGVPIYIKHADFMSME